jgi:hypothetical protein
MSNYLRDSKAFEKAIDRGVTSYRSSELTALTKAVKGYAGGKTRAGIENVRDCWNAWREKDPKEFADRGVTLGKDFEQELQADCEWLGVNYDAGDDDDFEPAAIPKARTVVVNRYAKYAKKTAKYVGSYGSSGYGVVDKAKALAGGAGIKAAVLGGAGALSATGFGLLALGGVATAASSGLAIKAFRSTSGHLKKLMILWNHRNSPELRRCEYIGEVNPLHAADPYARALQMESPDHDIVANHVLPYIIKQKSRKLKRKKISAIPLVGLVEGGRAILNYLGKKIITGTQGKVRGEHALWLANHFCEYDCELSRQIVAELYSVEEMWWLLDQKPADAAKLLAEKMQST